VAECPAAQAVADMLGQVGGRDGEHGAVGVGQAVTGDRAAHQPRERSPAAGADDQQVAGLAGQTDQLRAGLATQYQRPGPHAAREAAERGTNRVAQPLPGVLLPQPAQLGIGIFVFEPIAVRRHPREHRDQGGTVPAGQIGRTAQRVHAAR